jgi:GNAT superfamily N-acetyltransferase
VRRDRAAPEAFVWDVLVDESCRGQGYGTLILTALEEEVRALGVGRIALNVFAHNDGARRLYERLGYAPISTVMAKGL